MNKINKSKAQRRISRLWFCFTFVFVMFIVLSSISESPTFDIKSFFEWLSPLFFPTFLLILSLFIYDANQEAFKNISVNNFTFEMTFGISLAYLSVVFILIMAVSLNSELSAIKKIEKLREFSIFLGPFQGAVTAVLGIFFVKKDE